MDENPNVPEVRSGNGPPSSIRALRVIDPHNWPGERLKWLWEQLKTQDYAFDDPSRQIGHAVFLSQLFSAGSEWYEIGDDGLAGIQGIIPQCNAVIHFVIWGEVEPRDLFPLQRTLFESWFTRFELSRLTAYIPSFNNQAIRMATLTGFHYEGELRKAFLSYGKYYSLQVFGLLREEFFRREVRN